MWIRLSILSTNETRPPNAKRLATIAFHIAEAGIERGLYDLRQDFVTGERQAGRMKYQWLCHWAQYGQLLYIPYASTTFNNGSYTVQLKNVNR